MKSRKLTQLRRISELKKEMELAALARLARSEADAQKTRDDLVSAERAARAAALASAENAKATESFAGWVSYRQMRLEDELERLNDEILRQKDKAAVALGRYDVLRKI